MSDRHAAGPWEFDPLLGEVHSPDNAVIAKVYEPGDFPCADPGVYTEEEYRANGALLAAAPAMAEAIRTAAAELNDFASMGVSLSGMSLRAIAGRLRVSLPNDIPDIEKEPT